MVWLGERKVENGEPCYIVGEIGINHQADRDILSKLIDVAADAGCDAVKFQKRTPELQVPRHKWDVIRDTPWGEMSMIEYRRKIELSEADFDFINSKCQDLGIDWFASPWDEPSVDFLLQYNPVALKVASPCLSKPELLRHIAKQRVPVVTSTGMLKSIFDVDSVVDLVAKESGSENIILLHCVSDYPCQDDDVNLTTIQTMRRRYTAPIAVGYSGHEVGILPSVLAATVYGACMVERHITLDRGMKGSDHGASLEPIGLRRMIRDIRRAERLMMSDGVKRLTQGEQRQIERLRL